MICPTCNQETEGRNLNGRGLRCTLCGARVVKPESVPAETVEPAPEEKPKRKGKQ